MATINGDNGDNFLTGTEEEDVINGLGGNDTIDSIDRPANIFAGSINPRRDEVNAGSGDDFVTGGKLDQLNGGDGNDFLQVNFNFNGPIAGSATPINLNLDANGSGTASDGTFIAGFESVNFNLSDTGNNVINTGNVQAQITGGGGDDMLTTGLLNDGVFGGGGNDVISTGGGNDTINGGSGDDVVLGGDGDDSFGVNIYTDGADQVDLGTGNDTVRFDRFDGGAGNVRLTFTSSEVGNGIVNDAGSAANQDGGLAVRVQAEDANGDPTGPASRYDDEGTTFVAGTQGVTFDVRDLVSGTERGNTFEGVVLGTSGNDVLTFFPPFRVGQDFYYNAGQGNDTVTAGDGNDFLVGGAGNDLLAGNGGNDSFIGGVGSDSINGGAGIDTAIFNVSTDGADTVDLGNEADRVNVSTAAAGQVRLTFTSAEVGNGNAFDAGTMTNQDSLLAVRLQAEAADGTLTGPISRLDDEGITFVASSDGTTFDVRDLVAGTQRGDQFRVVVLGTDGADTFSPVAGRENESHYVNAGQGNDIVTGGSAADFLVGGAGDDRVLGGEADDQVLGGSGNDIIFGELGNDILRGDDGADFIGAGAGDDTVFGGNGDDTLYGEDGADTVSGDTGNDNLFGNSGDDRLLGGDGDDQVLGGLGGDIIFGEFGNDILRGEDDNDFIGAGAGNDFVSGGIGNDTLFGEDGADNMFGDTGTDRLNAGAGDDRAFGGTGDDTIFGEFGNDFLRGEEDNDFIGAGAGNDDLSGGAGVDSLYGEAGNDVLFGNAGNDELVGGDGNDTFNFGRGDGSDLVRDFAASDSSGDVISFNGGVFSSFSDVQAASQQVGADVIITYDMRDTITLQNVTFANLNAADFMFA
ncbi:calcium-binding protein [Methylobacterium flocculans]|uniref:calcium-binding protein n=1 Tax=Methylobacterium flocculans TaxID=2984843 RepID=UPI0021F2DDCE|nr:calcium-binding protein [Methylobacterium sp. FF17]